MITTSDLYIQYNELEKLWKIINIKRDLRLLKKVKTKSINKLIKSKYKII